MIVVRIELWPHGDSTRRKRLAEGIIANDGTGHQTHGNYHAVFGGKTEAYEPREARVTGFPRKQRNAWELLRRALNVVNETQAL